jgi:hypothetical protein
VIERQAVRNALLIPSPKFGGISWNYAPLHIKGKTLGREILCFGDSMVQLGVMPTILHDKTGMRAFNLAIQSGSAPSSYFLLRRALEAGARPSIIVVDFEKGILTDHPASKTRPYPWAELLSLRDVLELSWVARDPDLLADILVKQTVRSLNVRMEVRQRILSALRAEVNTDRESILATWRNVNRNQGACLYGKNPAFQDLPVIPRSRKGSPGTWECDRVNAMYVRKFLELAAQVHAQVYWLLTPASPGWQSTFEYMGNEARYIRFIRRIQKQNPHVLVVDARYSGFQPNVFLDSVHLDCEGAAALSTGLAEVIRDTRDKTGLAARWVALPAHHARPARPASSELFSESLAAIRSGRHTETVTK